MTQTSEQKTPDTIAFCYASGKIKFGLMMPKGALPIVRGKGRRIRELVSARARLAYDGKTLLVPGIPEAGSDEERFAAFNRFSDWIQGTLDKDAEIDAWNAAHPKGTRVIVHSTVGDYACKAHGRTTTKARLSGGKIVVRVQHSGENPWTDIDVLTFPEGGDMTKSTVERARWEELKKEIVTRATVPCSRCGETQICTVPTSHLPDPTKEGWATYHAACSDCGHPGPERNTRHEAYAAWDDQEREKSS